MGVGVSVSPSLARIDLSQDPPFFELKYVNDSTSPVFIKLTGRDFSSLEDGWRINFLEDPDLQSFSYSLSSWLKFTPENFLLLPQKSQTVKVDIRHSDLTPGAHYGSIVADLASSAPQQPADVQVSGQLISLAFVRASTGRERTEIGINSFSSTTRNLFSLPDKFLLRLNNSGNTEVVPRGVLIIYDFRNREVARGILNQQSLIVLPETLRRFEIPVSINQPIYRLPGFYQASLIVNYDSSTSASLTSNIPFFSFASKINFAIVMMIILLLSIFLIRLLKHFSLHPQK